MAVLTAIASIGRATTLDGESCGGGEVGGDAEAAGDVVRAAGGDQRELGLEARVRRRVEGPIAPEEHDPPLSRGERVVELLEGRRDAGLDARSD